MNIDVIVVTYNRLAKLKKALTCYDSQTTPCRNLIVVNNKLKYCKKINCKHLKRKKQNASYNGGIYTPAMTNCFCELKSCPYKRGIK